MAEHIGIIGGGNMAQALVGGLIADGTRPADLSVSDPVAAQRHLVSGRFGVRAEADNSVVAAESEVLVLAVKPQNMKEVACGMRRAVQTRRPLIITIAAGIHIESVQRWLGGGLDVVRAMPNSPCLIRSGITALHAGPSVSNAQRVHAERIMGATGSVTWVEHEDLMDAVTALSGSGPAYFFLLMEMMEQTARQLGLPEHVARTLTLNTGLGAARMALESGEDLSKLRHMVTSPGGTTAAALAIFSNAGLEEIFRAALTAARDRGREIARDFGEG